MRPTFGRTHCYRQSQRRDARRVTSGAIHMLMRLIFSLLLTFWGELAIARDPASPVQPNAGTPVAQAVDPAGGDGEVFEGEQTPPANGSGGYDPASLTTRIDRLERQLRQMTGENEELQHKVQTLEEQLRAARQAEAVKSDDVGKTGPSRALDLNVKAGETPPTPGPVRDGKRADAFRPSTAPDAPGAPKPLGVAAPSAPLETAPGLASDPAGGPALRDTGAPLDIAHGRLVGAPPAPGANDAPTGAALTPPTAASGGQQDFDDAIATLKAGRYEAAEQALSAFLIKNPKGKLTPAALYYIGESFYQRGRRREAAEKYLEISSKYGQSSLAPDALLRLGQSLAGLGAKDQACAAYNEIGVKYPAAVSRLREGVERESKKLQC